MDSDFPKNLGLKLWDELYSVLDIKKTKLQFQGLFYS